MLSLACAALASPPGTGWRVTLQDEFDGPLNTSLWTRGWSWYDGNGTARPRVQTKKSDTCYFADENVFTRDGKLVIVNKRDDVLTANLQGPLVINVGNCVAMQLVLAEKRWTTRQEIVRLEPAARAASA